MTAVPKTLDNVALTLKANIYFEGGVMSHTVHSPDGQRRTVGLIRPGQYHFTTGAPEQMDIISGDCRVQLAGDKSWKSYKAGESFNVPGNSAFDISVEGGITEYLCTFR